LRPLREPEAGPLEKDRRRYPFVQDLLDSAEFHRLYHLESYPMNGGYWLNIYELGTATNP
jgi:hypothetical protein